MNNQPYDNNPSGKSPNDFSYPKPSAWDDISEVLISNHGWYCQEIEDIFNKYGEVLSNIPSITGEAERRPQSGKRGEWNHQLRRYESVVKVVN